MKSTIALAAALAALTACNESPEFPTVRDVRPTAFELGDTVVIELDPSVPALSGDGATKVVFSGWLDAPDLDEAERTLELTARVGGPHRVLLTVDDYLLDEVGGRSMLHEARVTVLHGPAGATLQPIATSSATYDLSLFPKTVRKLANQLAGNLDHDLFLDWLGLDVELAEDGSGLYVSAVRGGFEGKGFMLAFDCGRWSSKDGSCKGGPDGKVAIAEALSQGYEDEETLAWVDEDGDGVINRFEAAHAHTEPSRVFESGVRSGDKIVTADGKPVQSVRDLENAWEGEGPTVALGLARGGEQLELAVGRYGRPAQIPSSFLMALVLVAAGLLVILPVPLIGGFIVVWERKISGYIQSRPGPNRVGPNGWLQWLADGVKLIVKEDIIPTEADPILFRASPFLVFTGVFLTFVVMPFSPFLQIADLNIGILYILSVTSIVVVGVIMGGWASNSKWSLLGGMRSAAQIISYELPASIAVLSIVVLVGSLSMQDIVRNQGGMPWEWHVFSNPFSFACFFIFFISALAEGNRTPFDLPEAESELVSGYNTEYSGFRFSIFALAEWVNLVVLGAVVTTLFLGGWQIPFVDPLQIEASGLLHLVSFMVFAAKVVFLIFVCIWIRWTLPRFRVDHMMTMCWKYFMPFSLVALMGSALWVWLLPDWARTIAGLVVFAVGGVGVFGLFLARVNYVRKTTSVYDLHGA